MQYRQFIRLTSQSQKDRLQQIRKIITKMSILIIDILVFAFNICRHLILPGKRKKGNLLSSLFIFFTGIIERLGSFEYGIFRMADLLKRRYIKQSLLIVAAVLFLLSSFEWTGDKTVYNNPSEYTVHLSDAGTRAITVSNHGKTTSYSNALFKQYSPHTNICLRSSIETSSVKKFLLIRNIRI